MIAGPKLRAGLQLVPEIGASAYTIREKRGGIRAGVYGRSFRNPRNMHSPAMRAKVVTASPIKAADVEYPAPGAVAPNSTLRPMEPQLRRGRTPRQAPPICASA